MSLRQVEEASQKAVSNAYLSQLENGKVAQPSPSVLNTLAELYGIEYMTLMQMAGYLPATNARSAESRHGRVATFAEHNLSPDEEAELIKYLQYLRTKKP
jgi:transcriptional regulator with XRE-family HTH domain